MKRSLMVLLLSLALTVACGTEPAPTIPPTFTPTVTAVPATPTSATTPTPVPTPTSAAPIALEDLRLGDTVAEYMAALTEEESRCLSGLAEDPQTADLLESALDMPLGEVEWFVSVLVGCLSAKHYVAYAVAAHEWIVEQMSNEMRVCMEELGAIEALTKLVPRLEPSGNTWTFDADIEDLELIEYAREVCWR